MKALRQELISTKFFVLFCFPLPSVLFADTHFQQNSPDLKRQMAWGNQRAPKHIIFPQMPSRAILAVKYQFISRFKSIQKHCRRNIHLLCVWEK